MIIYLVKSLFLLLLLYGLYKLLLENVKMHCFNRYFLLFALIFGLTAPLISFEVHPEQSIAGIKMQQMERVANAPAEAVSRSVEPIIAPKQKTLPKADITPVTAADEPGWKVSALDLLFGLYGLITLFLLIRFISGLMEIRNKIKAGSLQKSDPAVLVLLDQPITPQSFFRFIFLEKEQFEAGKIETEILDHELVHVRQYHSLDILFVEFLKIIFWFNPLIYLYKHAIQLNHEFLADESVVGNGSSVSDYQNMLIRVCAGSKPLNITSSISFSLTKKRLRMMGKQISRVRSNSIKIFLIPTLLFFSLLFCTTHKDENGLNAYEFKYAVDGIYYKSDPILYAEEDTTTYLYPFDPILLTEKGEPFTGTRKLYSRVSKDTAWHEVYNEGILTEKIFLNENLREKRNVSKVTYQFENGRYVARTVYDTTKNVSSRSEYTENSTRHYSSDGQLTFHGHTEIKDGTKWFYQNSWYPNGRLMYESFYDTSGSISQMTMYDEEGNIKRQTRVEDGEIIKRIE